MTRGAAPSPFDAVQLDALQREAEAVAREAGAAILAIRVQSRADPAAAGIEHKADASPVTRADRAAHDLITARLRALPGHAPVVSEEGSDAAPAACPGGIEGGTEGGLEWLVDPLDGTREFIAGRDDFTVNIALVVAGAPVFGVVHVPASGETFSGGRGRGAVVVSATQRRPIRVAAPPPAASPWRVVASRSHLDARTRAFIDRLGPTALVCAGSALKFCRVAQGLAEVYPRLAPTAEWDSAAAQAVLEGAGGHVVGLDGRPLRYGKPERLNPGFVAASVPPEELPGTAWPNR